MSKILHLKNRSVISVSGTHNLKFIQSLITNDVYNIDKEEGIGSIYTFLLNAQGKFLYDFFITKVGELILLDCQTKYITQIINLFNIYKLSSDVVIQDESAKFKVFYSDVKIEDNSFIDPRNSNLGFRTLTQLSFNDTITSSDYTYSRISYGVPDSDLDLTYAKSFILDFNAKALNAISYTKGCYIGQEVTARMTYRLNIRKKLYTIKFLSQHAVNNTELIISDKLLGQILSCEKDIALALLKIDEVTNLLSKKLDSSFGRILINDII